jgi:hypothetical protein
MAKIRQRNPIFWVCTRFQCFANDEDKTDRVSLSLYKKTLKIMDLLMQELAHVKTTLAMALRPDYPGSAIDD